MKGRGDGLQRLLVEKSMMAGLGGDRAKGNSVVGWSCA